MNAYTCRILAICLSVAVVLESASAHADGAAFRVDLLTNDGDVYVKASYSALPQGRYFEVRNRGGLVGQIYVYKTTSDHMVARLMGKNYGMIEGQTYNFYLIPPVRVKENLTPVYDDRFIDTPWVFPLPQGEPVQPKKMKLPPPGEAPAPRASARENTKEETAHAETSRRRARTESEDKKESVPDKTERTRTEKKTATKSENVSKSKSVIPDSIKMMSMYGTPGIAMLPNTRTMNKLQRQLMYTGTKSRYSANFSYTGTSLYLSDDITSHSLSFTYGFSDKFEFAARYGKQEAYSSATIGGTVLVQGGVSARAAAQSSSYVFTNTNDTNIRQGSLKYGWAIGHENQARAALYARYENERSVSSSHDSDTMFYAAMIDYPLSEDGLTFVTVLYGKEDADASNEKRTVTGAALQFPVGDRTRAGLEYYKRNNNRSYYYDLSDDRVISFGIQYYMNKQFSLSAAYIKEENGELAFFGGDDEVRTYRLSLLYHPENWNN